MNFIFSEIENFLGYLTVADPLFLELTVILILASVLGVALKKLGQPFILAYLVTGLIMGLSGFFDVAGREALELFSALGIMFLLFLVGLEMDYDPLKAIGKNSLILGLVQMFFSAVTGFLAAYFLFGFSILASAYIAAALSFSSTIIIIKLLTQKGDVDKLHGRLSVGLLLVQDVAVVFILLFLTISESGEFFSGAIIRILAVGVLLFGLMLALGRIIIPVVFKVIGNSQELLFLTTFAWLLFFGLMAESIGFSIEIAGFLGGVALANSSEKYYIANKVRPFRDFFILIFFVTIGSLMAISDFGGVFLPVLFFSLMVVVLKPLVVMLTLRQLGYTKRVNFLTAATIPQISEFSLILAYLGFSMGHISNETFTLIASVGIITFILSTYSIMNSEKFYLSLFGFLSFFEKEIPLEEEKKDSEVSKPVVLIGADKSGKGIMDYLNLEDLLVVDFGPLVTKRLRDKGIECILSDVTDPQLFDYLNFDNTKVVISTDPRTEDNLNLIEKIKDRDKNIKIIIRAEGEDEARRLYDQGADYVLLANQITGQHLGKIINPNFDFSGLERLRKIDLKLINPKNNQ